MLSLQSSRLTEKPVVKNKKNLFLAKDGEGDALHQRAQAYLRVVSGH
jgi:hypothetical protein